MVGSTRSMRRFRRGTFILLILLFFAFMEVGVRAANRFEKQTL